MLSDLNAMTEKPAVELRSVLVLGEDTRSFLSVVRSLGRAGYKVDVVCYDRTSPALDSKYISSIFCYNHQAYYEDEWLTHVLSLIEKYQYDAVFPCDERAIYPLWLARENIPSKTKLAIANQEALDVLFDKWQTKLVAKKNSLPVADGQLVMLSETNYSTLQASYGDVFVIKPLQSFGKTSLKKRNKVAIIRCEKDFIDFMASNPFQSHYLVEHYFSGYGEGLSVLAWQGKIQLALSYKRLAEPASGGGSSYRQVVETDPEQLAAVEMMCSATKLSGLAMFEFRRDRQSKRWILVEVNARAWGGMPLADHAGVDFPNIYLQFLAGDPVSTSADLPLRQVRARALTADLYEIKREGEQLTKKLGRGSALKHMAKRLLTIASAVSAKESIDSLRFDDPRPFFTELKAIIQTLLNPIVHDKRFLIQARRRRISRDIKNTLELNPNRRVLFVCYGNIIRSPFAQYYFAKQIEKHGVAVDIDSYGFHHREARPSPNIAISAASSLNCDLAEHKSKCLKQSDISETDLIIYFDEKNRSALESSYRTNLKVCAADLLDSRYPSLREIDDPYESDVETIAACYHRISNALDNLVLIYKGATT